MAAEVWRASLFNPDCPLQAIFSAWIADIGERAPTAGEKGLRTRRQHIDTSRAHAKRRCDSAYLRRLRKHCRRIMQPGFLFVIDQAADRNAVATCATRLIHQRIGDFQHIQG